MACSLPSEILDLIVDHLRDERTTLKACCVTSKSWVPRARKHLFARIQFHARERPIESWIQAFPDPSNSLAHHPRTLSFGRQDASTLVNPDIGRWIRAFHRVESLHMDTLGWDDYRVSFVQLHRFSPILKSLTLIHSSVSLSEVFSLICSFPLLEDLVLLTIGPKNETDRWNPPPTSPKFTGSLMISGGIHPVTCRLCDLPGGLRFSKITLSYTNEVTTSVTDLVSRCSDTLESLTISRRASDVDRDSSLDLSKATKLKDMVFFCGRSIQWITTTVKTAKSENLQQITITLYPTILTEMGETVYREWQDLDHLLVQLWTSRSIRPRVTYKRSKGEDDTRDLVSRLLPELTKRGVVDVDEYD